VSISERGSKKPVEKNNQNPASNIMPELDK